MPHEGTNPETGETLPPGYSIDDFHIIAPDDFAFPRNARLSDEPYWRDADEKAGHYLAQINQPTSEEQRHALLNPPPPPKGYTRRMAQEAPASLDEPGRLLGFDLRAVEAAAQGPQPSTDPETLTLPEVPAPRIVA